MQHCVVEGTGRANITDHYNVRSLASRGARARAPPYARRARARADAERVPAPPPRAQVRETNVIGWGRFSAIVLVASDERRARHAIKYHAVTEDETLAASFGDLKPAAQAEKPTPAGRPARGASEHAVPREHAYAECRALKRCRGCANVVQLVESFEDLSRVYLVLEFCDGGARARARARASLR